jgi:hypothetical protein
MRQIKGLLEITVGGRGGPGLQMGRGAPLTSGHAVIEIVHADNVNIHIAPCCMYEMIAAYCEQVPITRKYRHR